MTGIALVNTYSLILMCSSGRNKIILWMMFIFFYLLFRLTNKGLAKPPEIVDHVINEDCEVSFKYSNNSLIALVVILP